MLRRLLTSPYFWGSLFVFSGTMHFAASKSFERIVPPPLPPKPTVALSGVAEIAGGLGLMLRSTRRAAMWGLLTLLTAVFPANIYAARHPETMSVGARVEPLGPPADAARHGRARVARRASAQGLNAHRG